MSEAIYRVSGTFLAAGLPATTPSAKNPLSSVPKIGCGSKVGLNALEKRHHLGQHGCLTLVLKM